MWNFIKIFVNIPLVDRTPTRLAIYPLSLVFLISAANFESMFSYKHKKISIILKIILLSSLSYFLLIYSLDWFLTNHEPNKNLIDSAMPFGASILNYPEDSNYINIVIISYLISIFSSILSLIFLIFLYKKN